MIGPKMKGGLDLPDFQINLGSTILTIMVGCEAK